MADEYPKTGHGDTVRLVRPLAARVHARQFPIQEVGLIPWSVAERAYARYASLYGRKQSLERLAERGGFGLAELGYLLRGYGRPAVEDDRDWRHACEYATKEILATIAQENAR